jgi:Golgi CORVET complex core vacuolar protein 8
MLQRGDAHALERWLLKLDASSALQTEPTLTLLHQKRLYTGLLHVCSAGLGDYLTALETLLQVAVTHVAVTCATAPRVTVCNCCCYDCQRK